MFLVEGSRTGSSAGSPGGPSGTMGGSDISPGGPSGTMRGSDISPGKIEGGGLVTSSAP